MTMDWQRFSKPTGRIYRNPTERSLSYYASSASQRAVRTYCNRTYPGWSNADHEKAARNTASTARSAVVVYKREVKEALDKYGDHGPLVSGIVRSHFPDAVKTRLRSVVQDINIWTDMSIVHWRCSGRRKSWREEFSSKVFK